MSGDAALGKAEELLERLRSRVDGLERLAESGDVEAAVDELADIAELAKQIEAEIQQARTAADAAS